MVGSPPLTSRGLTLAALLIVLGKPAWWLLALAGFLARGGIVLFLLAVVSLPSPLVLSNILAPLITPLAFGTLLPETAVLIALAIGLTLFWLIAGGWFAAAGEVVLIREAQTAAAEEGLASAAGEPVGDRLALRATMAHLVAHVPTAVVLALGSVAIVRVIYAELTNPSDAGPIALRVIAAASGPIVAIVVVWAVGEIVGGLAVRRIAIGGSSVLGGVAQAVADLVRRPLGALVVPLATMVVLAIDMAAVLSVVAIVLDQTRDRLRGGMDDPVATGLTVATLGAAWSLALIVTGLILAWRSVALTFETGRVIVAGHGTGTEPGGVLDGTIGASTHRRPGDRSVGDPDGSL